MSKMMVAKSYANAERIGEPFEKNGKLYTKIKEKCDRCSGHGIIVARVENGQLIPIPVDGGVCYSCLGKGYFIKEVRLYTEEEYARMEAANERTRQKKAEALEAKMKAEFEQNKLDWLQKNGFTPDGKSYVVKGDSYSIKEQLKQDNFRYDPVLRWHRATKEGYEDKVIEIDVNDYFEFSAWGQGHYIDKAKDKMDSLLKSFEPHIETEYYGEVGGKVKDITVQLTRFHAFEGKYGITHVLTMADGEGHVFTWFTSTFPKYEVGDYFKISSATIKDHSEYNDIKQTVITRARLKDIEGE